MRATTQNAPSGLYRSGDLGAGAARPDADGSAASAPTDDAQVLSARRWARRALMRYRYALTPVDRILGGRAQQIEADRAEEGADRRSAALVVGAVAGVLIVGFVASALLVVTLATMLFGYFA